MMTLDEMSGECQSYDNSLRGNHECLYRISWDIIQQLLRYLTQNHKCKYYGDARKSTKAIRIHPLGIRNVCKNINISLLIKVVD